jgi:hypothetical protein
VSDIDDGVGDIIGAGSAHSSLLIVVESLEGSSSIEDGVGVGAGAASAQSEGSRGPGVVVCAFLSAVRGVGDVSVSMLELCALMLSGVRFKVGMWMLNVEVVGVLSGGGVVGGGVIVAMVVLVVVGAVS